MTETNEHHDATSEEHPQLVELLSRLVDGGFTPEDQQQLESLLQARPDLRAYYIEYLSTWALLDAELAPKPVALQKDDAPPRATASTAARPIAGRIGTLRYAAAAVITIGAITAALLIQELDAPRELGSVAVTAPHTDDAVLTYAENATWDGDRPEDGSRVQAPLRLKSGRAQLLFDGGAVATLEGDASELDLEGGRLGALQDLRATTLPGYLERLDDLAAGLISEVNAIHETGVGGQPFFTGTDAATIEVSQNLVDDASAVHTGTGNELALQMVELQDAPVASLGDQTFSEHFQSTVVRIGGDATAAKFGLEARRASLDQVQTQREQIEAVSLDEEMANMIAAEHAYQAAARLLTTSSEMLETLISIG